MKRVLSAFATIAVALLGPFARMPAWAQLLSTGVGGGLIIATGVLTPPTLVPQFSAAPDSGGGFSVNGGGAAGAFYTTPSGVNSWYIAADATVDAAISAGATTQEFLVGSFYLSGGFLGPSQFQVQNAFDGTSWDWWQGLAAIHPSLTPLSISAAGSGYNSGLYTWTATGGNCGREPSGLWTPPNTAQTSGAVTFTDPGFGCSTAPTVSLAAVPGAGVKQALTTGATSCVSNSPVSGEMTVTTSVAVAHGVAAMQTYTLSGFTGAGNTGYNATYTALAGTTGTTLVGETTTGGGTCPANSPDTSGGFALSGTGAAISIPAFSSSAPLGANAGTGITAKGNDHFCMIYGEYGPDSPTPGVHFVHMIDRNGNPFPGAPSVANSGGKPILNQGTVAFTGYIVTGGQPALTVTAMNSLSITNAVWSSANNGTVVFTTSAAHWLTPGSEFIVSGMTPGGFNGTYVANGLGSGTTGSTITAVSFPVANLANPGAFSAGGSLVGVIQPGMYMPGIGAQAVISPYGTGGASGTGGVGTYNMNGVPATQSITASISATTMNVTAVAAGFSGWMVAGTTLSTTGGVTAGTVIQAQTSGSGGGAGNYTVNNSQTVTSQTLTTTGAIWSSSTPGTIYAGNPYYYSVQPFVGGGVAGGGGFGGARGQTTLGDLSSYIASGWGGQIANIGMHWGAFPQANSTTDPTETAGAPSTSALASLCQKTTDVRAFDIANSITTRSLYRLNDPGEWGDSSYATITGYLDTASGTSGGTATLHVSSTVWGTLALPTGTATAFLAAPGLPRSPTPASVNPASIPLTTSSSATYTVTFPTGMTSINLGSSGTPVAFSVGQWKPAAPNVSGAVNGYITSSGGSGACASNPCLTVTSLPAGTYNATFIGTYNPTTGGLSVSGVSGTIAAGELVTDGGVSIAGAPLAITSGSGSNWNARGGYYTSTITADATMSATRTFIAPNQYLTGPGINAPVSITGFATGSTIPGAGSTYLLSSAANGNVGSSGSPIAITLSNVAGGGAVAPGLALTLDDVGSGAMYAVNNLPSSSPTASIPLKGTYSTSLLGGTPTAIQVQLSNIAGGPAVGGFAWQNLTSQSITGGNWSGTLLGVPPGQYWVSVRAANGVGFVTMHNFITVGFVIDYAGEGSIGAFLGSDTGANNTVLFGRGSTAYGTGAPPLVYGPAIGKFRQAYAQAFSTTQYTGAWAEGQTALSNDYFRLTGVGVGQLTNIIDGNWSGLSILGNTVQTETVGIGDGTSTTWCSKATLCSNHPNGTLAFNAAALSGAQITGYITTTGGVSTLTVSGLTNGALSPGFALSGPGITGSPTLVGCVTTCAITTSTWGTGSTWTLSSNQGTVGSSGSPILIYAGPSGGAPEPLARTANFAFPLVSAPPNFGQQTMKMGTFTLSVNGTQVCADTATFAYNVYSGVCTGPGVASSFINYSTGDYAITFATPPASGAAINAQWTEIISHNSISGPEQVDNFGDGSATTGEWSASFEKFPAGASAHVFGGCNSDAGMFYPYAIGSIGYSQFLGYFYETKMASLIPGQTANVPAILIGYFRAQGPGGINASNQLASQLGCDQWFRDATTSSTFTGTVTGGGTSNPILTLNSNVTGQLWEGETLGCAPYSLACFGVGGSTANITLGTQVTGILSGTWGVSGSTYSLTSPSGPTGVVNVSSQPMMNAAYFDNGAVTAVYAGPDNDIVDQNGPAAFNGGYTGHPSSGAAGGRRIGHRAAVQMAATLTNNSTFASPPTLNRATMAGCDTSAIAAPCFDIGNTFAATATTTAIGGAVLTFNGLSPNARVITDGMAASCSGCNTGLYVVAVSNPPTQSQVAGQGQIGSANNGFTVTLNAAPGVSGTNAFTFGCKGVAGTGSNCIDLNFSVNTAGTYGTPAAIANCGANNLHGSPVAYPITASISGTTITVTGSPTGIIGYATSLFGAGVTPNTYVTAYGSGSGGAGTYTISPSQTVGSEAMTAVSYTPPAGACADPGVGDIVRTFRIGNQQNMGATATSAPTGNFYDDGLDVFVGTWSQSGAFTCNIVAAKVVQCVKAPVYASGVPTSIGQWLSSGTFLSFGDAEESTGRIGTLMGYVGGQSFAFSAGSGYTPGTYHLTGSSCGQALIFAAPVVDVVVGSGGSIVDVYPSAVQGSEGGGITSPCTFALTGMGAGTGGAVTTLTYGPNEGQGGYETFGNDSNMFGEMLFDNSGEPGNPLNSYFGNPDGGPNAYFEPGLPVKFGNMALGVRVSG